MATIRNTEKRLITMPQIPGHKLMQLLPGRNPLDPEYWRAVKQHSMVKLWLREGMIKVDMKDDMPDPNVPPDAKTLDSFTKRELERALKDQAVPVQWHPALEAELAKRNDEEVRKRLAPSPSQVDPHKTKSLVGIKIDDAIPIVSTEESVDMLNAWLEADDRRGIENAIVARLAELADDDDGDDED